MILFVGDKPSAKNKDPEIAFVGTQSGKRLLSWVAHFEIDINHVKWCNRADLTWKKYGMGYLTIKGKTDVIFPEDKIVYLGVNAAKGGRKVNSFNLPHPSGLNRLLNDEEWLEGELNKCKEWLHG